MSSDRHLARRSRLVRAVQKTEADALLVTNPTNVTYLTGFSGDSSWLLLGRDLTLMVSDSRYMAQLEEECPGLEVHIRTPQTPLIDAAAEMINKVRLRKLGFESSSMVVDHCEQLREKVKPLELVPVSGAVEELRQLKDADEVTAIREAIRQAEQGFAVLRASLVGGMTELEAAHELEHAMRRFGALRASFDPIVAVGPRSALPHARPTSARLADGEFVLIDWGASTARGYKSDLTRFLATAKISPKLEKVYRVVIEAQQRGLEAIRPGVRGEEVDAAARKVIDNAGYGKYFGHGLGHGIGLDIHEGPRLGPNSDVELKPGMVVTVEPGIYLPGWGGVRIEDDVLVTRDGAEVLTSVSKQLEQCLLG